MNRFAVLTALVVLAGAAAWFGIRAADDDGSGGGSASGQSKSEGSAARPGAAETDDTTEAGQAGGSKAPQLPESSCPPELSNCVVASGRVIYVEAVDPDGDGDAHFVTNSPEGITFDGVTVFDVRQDLQPEPLPRVGDLVGGAGPVFEGSYGQKQIEVMEFHVAR
jgi:hypothetical protein